MKVIVADDESWVRAGLVSMIHDMESDWQVVGEASNGEELLDLIRTHKPNTAVIDIRMPKMSGLEAMRIGKELSPYTKWILLSGFSDFVYAQEAVKLGAAEYLLKPVNPDELEKALNNTAKNNAELLRLLNQQFENSLFALCNGLTTLRFEERDSIFHQGFFMGSTIIFDTANSGNGQPDTVRQLYDALRLCISKELIHGMHIALLSLPSGELAAVGAWDPAKGNEGMQRVRRFFHSLDEIANRFRSSDVTVTVLQTDECHGFEALNKQLQQIQHWSALRAVCGIGRRIGIAELEAASLMREKAKLAHLLCMLKHHIHSRSYMNYQVAVGELEAVWPQHEMLSQEKNSRAIRLFMRYALGAALSEDAKADEMIEALRTSGEIMLLQMKTKEPQAADLIEQVIQYIDKHYMNDIAIGQIARQLNVSANYLSMLFHKKTGTPFVKYLTTMRMLKAKELLLNTNLQIKQIAEQVGYYSTRHFTKLFTEHFASYPSDFRKGHFSS